MKQNENKDYIVSNDAEYKINNNISAEWINAAKYIEEFKKYQYTDPRRVLNYEEIKKEITLTQESADVIQKNLESLKRMLSLVEGLPFAEGDAAFHRVQGNVLIRGFVVDADKEDVYYAILTKNGSKIVVDKNELIPISDATKVLYKK